MEVSWYLNLKEEFEKPYFIDLKNFVEKEREVKNIYPEKGDVFNSFNFHYNKLKVVIIGQDPYHTPGVANGLAFSVNKGKKIPPSLKNIFKEIKNEYEDYTIPDHGDLSSWKDQGVLLLNTVLTVEQGKANSHKSKGWEIFTDNVIKLISKTSNKIVFILWGKQAYDKELLIDSKKHLTLESAHPSPFSARLAFFGNNHFADTNKFLKQNNKEEINW